jgi:glycine dehydrogenase subunit 2
MPELLVFEKSRPGREGVKLPQLFDPQSNPTARLSAENRRAAPASLPRLSELEVVRHYTRLSQKNFSIDTHFYPLGSCTMKYNPKACDRAAAEPGFAALHPWQTEAADIQGILKVFFELERWLCEICGMDAFSLTPAAGANGEFAGVSLIRAWHHKRGDGEKRDTIVVPASAHGTNPASAALCGYKVREVAERSDGCVDLEALRAACDDHTAGLMLTNPNTVGVFEKQILQLAEVVHAAGGLLYYDGANLNAIAGRARPGDMGFDVVHINLHKTFSTPHGGGGPGAGPVGVKAHLKEFLPMPRIKRSEGAAGNGAGNGAGSPAERFELLLDDPQSIGKMMAFHGNTGILIRAYTYMLMLGAEGIRRLATFATLNANYLKARLSERYVAAMPGLCSHEFVLTMAKEAKENHVTAFNVAKRLLDKGFHSPTIYFPATVRECLLIEPTETEAKRVLDAFVDAMMEIRAEIESGSEDLLHAPRNLEMGRIDEVKAAKELNVCCRP